MSELILTPEEKAASDWLSLPNKSIADTVRYCGVLFKKAHKEGELKEDRRPLVCAAAMHICVEAAVSSNSAKTTLEFEGLSFGKQDLGKWRMTLEKL